MPGRNAFANLNPCFYHSSEPVIYSTLLTYKSGQAQHKSSYLPAVHHCISMFCAAASNSLGNANITIILWWILMGWALNADRFTKHDGSLQILGGQIKLANWQTGHSLCVFFKEKKPPTAVGVCPWFSGLCSCPWHHRGGWHSSRLFPSQMSRALGCCSSWPPARLSPLPPQPPRLHGCTTGRRLPSSSAGSRLFPTWASVVGASLLGNKPGLAEGPKGLRIPNPTELYRRFPVLMKLLAVFLGSRQSLLHGRQVPHHGPGLSASQSYPKGWEGFFCFSLYTGKTVQKGCMEIINRVYGCG